MSSRALSALVGACALFGKVASQYEAHASSNCSVSGDCFCQSFNSCAIPTNAECAFAVAALSVVANLTQSGEAFPAPTQGRGATTLPPGCSVQKVDAADVTAGNVYFNSQAGGSATAQLLICASCATTTAAAPGVTVQVSTTAAAQSSSNAALPTITGTATGDERLLTAITGIPNTDTATTTQLGVGTTGKHSTSPGVDTTAAQTAISTSLGVRDPTFSAFSSSDCSPEAFCYCLFFGKCTLDSTEECFEAAQSLSLNVTANSTAEVAFEPPPPGRGSTSMPPGCAVQDTESAKVEVGYLYFNSGEAFSATAQTLICKECVVITDPTTTTTTTTTTNADTTTLASPPNTTALLSFQTTTPNANVTTTASAAGTTSILATTTSTMRFPTSKEHAFLTESSNSSTTLGTTMESTTIEFVPTSAYSRASVATLSATAPQASPSRRPSTFDSVTVPSSTQIETKSSVRGTLSTIPRMSTSAFSARESTIPRSPATLRTTAQTTDEASIFHTSIEASIPAATTMTASTKPAAEASTPVVASVTPKRLDPDCSADVSTCVVSRSLGLSFEDCSVYVEQNSEEDRTAEQKKEFLNAVNGFLAAAGAPHLTTNELFNPNSLAVTICGSISVALPVLEEQLATFEATLSTRPTLSLAGQNLTFDVVTQSTVPLFTSGPTLAISPSSSAASSITTTVAEVSTTALETSQSSTIPTTTTTTEPLETLSFVREVGVGGIVGIGLAVLVVVLVLIIVPVSIQHRSKSTAQDDDENDAESEEVEMQQVGVKVT